MRYIWYRYIDKRYSLRKGLAYLMKQVNLGHPGGSQLPPASLHVLLCLTEGERHGYGIMQTVEANTDGQIRLGPGTLYGTLKRLLALGVIEEIKPQGSESGLDRRRSYRLTECGSQVLAQELQWLDRLVKMPTARRVLGDAARLTGTP